MLNRVRRMSNLSHNRIACEGEPPQEGTVLALDLRDAHDIVRMERPRMTVIMARFGLLDRRLLDSVQPHCVLFPLLGPDFDAVQVIERLDALRFQGSLCVVAPASLPAPGLVLRELRAAGRCTTMLTLICRAV
jgi:hypothetical protein